MPFPTEIHWDRRLHGDYVEIERRDGTFRPACVPEWDWPDANPFSRLRLFRRNRRSTR